MEELTPFDRILEPDFRTTCRGISLHGLHSLAARYELSPAAPEQVRHQFEIARHCFVYAWFYTPLCGAAEFYAILAAELALRARYSASARSKQYSNEPGLKKLLEIAIAEGWIADDGFEFDYSEPIETESGIEYRTIPLNRRRRPTQIVLDMLPAIRNERAHGKPSMMLERVTLQFQLACEIVNQLFPHVRPIGAESES